MCAATSTRKNDTTVTVTPPESGRFSGNVGVYCGLAGTVMRFVPGLALFADAPVRFDGDDQAYARPMQPVLDGLEQLGARVEYHGEHGRLPFTITPPRHDGEQADDGSAAAKVSIDSSGSSQFISGLLLIGSRPARWAGVAAYGGEDAEPAAYPHDRR